VWIANIEAKYKFKILVQKSILSLGIDRFLFESVRNKFHGNNKIPGYEGNPKHQKIEFGSLHCFCSLNNARGLEKILVLDVSILSDLPVGYS